MAFDYGNGDVRQKGDMRWEPDGNDIVIHGVVLNGLGGFDATVTVPWRTGHYTGTLGPFITLPPFIHRAPERLSSRWLRNDLTP